MAEPTLDAETLTSMALDATGLDDFGEATWQEGLERYVDSLNTEARLHELGEQIVAGEIIVKALADSAEETDGEAPPARGKPIEVRLKSIDELVEYFITAGKKGIAVNRYKGLGEMNPDQLWETTMNPTARTLLQVRAEDHTEADLMFTTLMGDQVEPRRKFIEDNALDVKNLDV